MPDNRVSPCATHKDLCVKEAVCINTKKVYDSCKDRDCVENLRVYLTCRSQNIVDNSVSVKVRSAKLIWCCLDVEEVPFNRGFYTVDVKFFYRIVGDSCGCAGRPQEIEGLAAYGKRVILFGSEGTVRIFTSQMALDSADRQLAATSNLPSAVCEAVDPIVLDSKVVEACHRHCCGEGLSDIPDSICRLFNDELSMNSGEKLLYVTLGQFSIIKLQRDSQLLIPMYDFCVPEKECPGNETDPCDMFNKIKFPVNEFFPPSNACDESERCGR